jgi:hypothetical protein
MSELLTLEKLKSMKPGIFIRGFALIEHPWFNHAGNIDDFNLTPVKFVATRGEIHDWAIYHSLSSNFDKSSYLSSYDHLYLDWGTIYRSGTKLQNKETIKQLVPCNDEALKWYRR